MNRPRLAQPCDPCTLPVAAHDINALRAVAFALVILYDDLEPVLPLVLARVVGQDWHKAGTFRHHLAGVARTLAQWQQLREVRLHSVDGNDFVCLIEFDAAIERNRLHKRVGDTAENLVYHFCTASRARFTERVLAGAFAEDGSVTVDRIGAGQGTVRLSAYEVAALVIVTMADFMEQWFSCQDDMFSGFSQVLFRPQAAHWMASLWPGPMRPIARVVIRFPGSARPCNNLALRDLLPIPPVFGGCNRVFAAADDAVAASLYWPLIHQDHQLVQADAATAVLEQAVRHDPWVGEPQIVLAQLYCRAVDAKRPAWPRRAHCSFSARWGNAWANACSGKDGRHGRATCCNRPPMTLGPSALTGRTTWPCGDDRHRK